MQSLLGNKGRMGKGKGKKPHPRLDEFCKQCRADGRASGVFSGRMQGVIDSNRSLRCDACGWRGLGGKSQYRRNCKMMLKLPHWGMDKGCFWLKRVDWCHNSDELPMTERRLIEAGCVGATWPGLDNAKTTSEQQARKLRLYDKLWKLLLSAKSAAYRLQRLQALHAVTTG